MSRIGYKAIKLPKEVTVTKDGDQVTVKGPKGELTRSFDPRISLKQDDGVITFDRQNKNDKALHGTMRANLNSMVVGVTKVLPFN